MESPRTKAKCARDQRKEKEEEPAATGPGHPAPARKSGQKPGHPAPRYRTSRSFALQPGHPAPQPGHPAPPEAPDIRPVARTSGHPCLRTVRAEARVPLRPLDYIYSFSSIFLGLALV